MSSMTEKTLHLTVEPENVGLVTETLFMVLERP